jgi:hypothetical protein
VQYVTKRHEKKEKSGEHEKAVEMKFVKVDEGKGEEAIEEVFRSFKDDDLFKELPVYIEDREERWKMKIMLSTAILHLVVDKGDDAAKATVLFQALSAVNSPEKVKPAKAEEGEEPENDNSALLRFLVRKLKELETREDVLREADSPKLKDPEVALGTGADDQETSENA